MHKYGEKLFELPLADYVKLVKPEVVKQLPFCFLDLDDPLYWVKVYEGGMEIGYKTDKWFMGE